MSHFRSFASLFAAAGILAGCSDSTAPEPNALELALAQVAEVEAFTAMGTAAAGVPVLSSRHSATDDCAFAASSQSFVCPPVVHNGLTLERSFQLLTGSGSAQASYDPATTAAVRAIIDLSGTPTGGQSGGVTLTIAHHSDQTVGGLLTTTRTIEGTSNTDYEFSDDDGSFTLSSNTEANLALPPTGTVNGFPTGTISSEVTSSEGGSPILLTMSFNGTSTATITRTVGDVTQTCTMNLATPGQAPNCS